MAKKIIANIRVGKADVKPDTPSHTPGVAMGNAPLKKETAEDPKDPQDLIEKAEPDRSTGVNPKKRLPIDADMPNLPPA